MSGGTLKIQPAATGCSFSGHLLFRWTTFFTAAANGTLPAFSFIDPDYSSQSQENPQNIVVGEALMPPVVQPGEELYEGFARYGFRVPSVVVSPYAKCDHVSHVVHDHTSVLAFVERKWNLPAFTYRDANANDLTDFLDLGALAAGNPTFPELPPLAAPGDTAARLACSTTGPGTIPPSDSITG
ncbi:MAG TPA: alkaline phosphatase family protein [Trebonia sp.]